MTSERPNVTKSFTKQLNQLLSNKTAVTVLLGPSDVIHDTYRLDLILVIHKCDVRTDRLYVFKIYFTLLKGLIKFGYLETDSYTFHSSVRVVNL